MKIRYFFSLLSFCIPLSLFADQSLYCPQNHGYISIGMTPEQVIKACGQPISQQPSSKPIMQKVPVQQMIFNNQGSDTAFYGVWNVPTGSGGTSLQVNIVNQRVKSISVNGGGANSFSICGGANIQVGDPVGKVYGACGSPAVLNNTFIEEAIPTATKPQVWIYQMGQYQSTVSLTFVDGKLQSIGN